MTSLLATSNSVSDLAPYLVLLVLGFLIGAWGQSARFPVAVIAGLLLIMIAAVGFIVDNRSGSCGVPGLC